MMAPMSKLTTVLVAVGTVAFTAVILFGVARNFRVAEEVIRIVAWPLGKPNRRAICLISMAFICLVAGFHSTWGDSMLASDIRDMPEFLNRLAEYNGWATRFEVPPPAPTVTKWWWFGWSLFYLGTFIVYVPFALKSSLAWAIENYRRKRLELDETVRAEVARRPAPTAGGTATTSTGGGTTRRWGAIFGTLFLLIEFVGDVLLHGSVRK